jgi:hypothetical protein
MANGITSTILDEIVSQNALLALTKKIAPINAFTTNFSSEAARKGDTIRVLVETYPNEAADTKTTHSAYSIRDLDSTTASITLSEPVYVSFALDDVEVASSSVVNLEIFGNGKGNKLAVKIMQDVLADITNQNFGAAAFVGAAGTFDADDVADVKDALDDADVPDEGRVLVLSNAYITNLLKDNAIQSNPNIGSEPIREGVIGRLMGFDVIGSNIIPANNENLVGFACHPSAIAVAMRYLQPQPGNSYLRAEPMTDPRSGITMGVRDWYDNDSGVRKMVYECVYGSTVTGLSSLVRITSA